MSGLFRDLPLRIQWGCISSSHCSIACSPLSRIILPVQGLVYTITDVLELHDWMCTHFKGHPLFEHVPLEELVSWEPIREIVKIQALSRVVLYSLNPVSCQ